MLCGIKVRSTISSLTAVGFPKPTEHYLGDALQSLADGKDIKQKPRIGNRVPNGIPAAARRPAKG